MQDRELHPGLGKVAQYGTAAIQVRLKLPAPCVHMFRDVEAAISRGRLEIKVTSTCLSERKNVS